MSKQKSQTQQAGKKVGELTADRDRLIEKIGALEREQATASVDRLQQIAVELGAARAALPSLDGQIEAARREVAAAQLVERQAAIAEWQRKDAELDGEILPHIKALLEVLGRKRDIARELHALDANGRGVPLALWDALERYVITLERPPGPTKQDRRAEGLWSDLERWRRQRDEIKRAGADGPAVQTRLAELDGLIKRDEAELRALGKELPKDKPAATPGVDQMTGEQRRIFDQARQQIAEMQGG